MDGRKWEELGQDCLAKVFEKLGAEIVGFETLLVDIPFVCKSWYKASFDPQSRMILNFSILQNASFVQKYSERFGIKKFSSPRFMKLVARCSTSATALVLPSGCTAEELDWFSAQCPSVTYLSASIKYFDEDHINLFAEAVGKFKFLQTLDLNRCLHPIDAILAEISLNCKNFCSLGTRGILTPRDVSAIARYTPRIKSLSLKGSALFPSAFRLIIRACKELEFLDISDCLGGITDEDILKEVTHLKHFFYTGYRKLFSDEEEELLKEVTHLKHFFYTDRSSLKSS